MKDKHNSKHILITIAAALVLLTGGTGLVLATKLDSAKSQATKVASAPPPETPSVEAASTNQIIYDGQEGKTALELLQANATVIAKDSAYGPYVDSINGIVGGTDGKHWALYINSQLSSANAGAYTTKDGDRIEWKFE